MTKWKALQLYMLLILCTINLIVRIDPPFVIWWTRGGNGWNQLLMQINIPRSVPKAWACGFRKICIAVEHSFSSKTFFVHIWRQEFDGQTPWRRKVRNRKDFENICCFRPKWIVPCQKFSVLWHLSKSQNKNQFPIWLKGRNVSTKICSKYENDSKVDCKMR